MQQHTDSHTKTYIVLFHMFNTESKKLSNFLTYRLNLGVGQSKSASGKLIKIQLDGKEGINYSAVN